MQRRQMAQLAAAVAGVCGACRSLTAAFAVSPSSTDVSRPSHRPALRGHADVEVGTTTMSSSVFRSAACLAPLAGTALVAQGRRIDAVGRRGGAGAGGDLEDLVPFELRGFPLPPLFTGIGLVLLVLSGYDYFSGASGLGGVGSFIIIYAVPLILIGISLFYAELQPVPVQTGPGAEGLFDEKATATLKKVKSDVTRHRYGDDAHLDSSLRVLGLAPQGGGKWPKLVNLKEEKGPNGELEFTLYFESKDVPYTRWSDPNKLKSFDRYFGPGVWSEVYKEDAEKRIAALKLTTGTRPEATETSTSSPVTAAAAFRSMSSARESSACFAGASMPAQTQRSSHLMRRATPAEEVDRFVGENSVLIFSKTFCPFCRKAKKALSQEGAEFTVVELDERDDGDDVQAALLEKTGVKTVPQVFVGGTFIGGGDDTKRLQKSGELAKLIAEAQA